MASKNITPPIVFEEKMEGGRPIRSEPHTRRLNPQKKQSKYRPENIT